MDVIPTVILIALLGAVLVPRHLVWVTGAAVAWWIAILLVEGPAVSAGELFVSVALAAANAAVAVSGVWIVHRAITD